MEDGVEEIPLTGFDAAGEPYLRRTAAGRLWLGFQLMPPSWAGDADAGGPWADVDARLAAAVGVPVVWEDREWFRIDHPRPDTAAAVARFLRAERQRLDPGRGAG